MQLPSNTVSSRYSMRMVSNPPKGHVWQQDRHDPHFGRPTGTVGDPERWYSMFASESVAPSGMQSFE